MNDDIRALFPIAQEMVYLFNGNINACPTPVRAALGAFLDDWVRTGDGTLDQSFAAITKSNTLFAEMIGTSPQNIVGVPNTTMGINLAAQMIRPQPGQNIVTTDQELVVTVHPWLPFTSQGVEMRYVAARNGCIAMEDLAEAIDDQTAAVSICHVMSGTGFRVDLRELARIAHSHGAKLVVDAAQSAGCTPIDVTAWEVDFLSAPTFKWLMGPTGVGFLYVCPEMVAACDPPLPGWFGLENVADVDLRHPVWFKSAQKFERGLPSTLGYIGAAAGLQMLHDIGYTKIYDEVERLSTYLHEQLTALGVTVVTPANPQQRAGIIAMQTPGQDQLHEQLEQKKIHVGNWMGCLRIDPAFYNTTAELDALLTCVRDCVADHS
jgi:cysteine desulfurase/selenocysteine lyase